MTKIELIRSIIPLSPTSARINLTIKNGESYCLLDSVVIENVEVIKANSQIHEMNLVDSVIE